MSDSGRGAGREPEPDAARAAAAGALASLRAAVMQRQSELAATGQGGDDLAASLAELRRHEFVQEPQPVSPRPGVGRVIVWLRRAVYHLFGKWHARAVLQQQNEFNQSVSALVAALAERERETRVELARLRRRLDALEALKASSDSAGPGGISD